jgi:hypothetical protein
VSIIIVSQCFHCGSLFFSLLAIIIIHSLAISLIEDGHIDDLGCNFFGGALQHWLSQESHLLDNTLQLAYMFEHVQSIILSKMYFLLDRCLGSSWICSYSNNELARVQLEVLGLGPGGME